MNVILLEKIGNLGDLGDEVSVKPGFARNYLLPQGRAVTADDRNRTVFEGRRAELEASANEKLVEANAEAESRFTPCRGRGSFSGARAGNSRKRSGQINDSRFTEAAWGSDT